MTETVKVLVVIETSSNDGKAILTRDWLLTHDIVTEAKVIFGESDVYAFLESESTAELQKFVLIDIQNYEHTTKTVCHWVDIRPD